MRKSMKKHTIAGLMNHIVSRFVVIMMFLLLSCNGQKKVSEEKDMKNQTAGLELLHSDANSGAEDSETLIITNTKALKSFYSKVNRTRKPGLPIPDVDFEKEMVIITCSGPRTDGSLPLLKFREETDSQIMLETTVKTGPANSQGTTSPFSLYKMPLTDKEIVFEAHQ